MERGSSGSWARAQRIRGPPKKQKIFFFFFSASAAPRLFSVMMQTRSRWHGTGPTRNDVTPPFFLCVYPPFELFKEFEIIEW